MMRLILQQGRRRPPPPDPVVAYTAAPWLRLNPEPLFTILTPSRDEAMWVACETIGGVTSGDVDLSPVRLSELPEDLRWRYARQRAGELRRGDAFLDPDAGRRVLVTRVNRQAEPGFTRIHGRLDDGSPWAGTLRDPSRVTRVPAP